MTKQIRKIFGFTLTAAMALSLAANVCAAEFYPATSYEDTYGTQYNYGGPNLVDYQTPALEYGMITATQTGVMEKGYHPSLQTNIQTSANGGYGIGNGGPAIINTPVNVGNYPVYEQPAFTSVDGMTRTDGSIGTVKIATLGINMKVWEGETNTSMAKGLGHYSSTSAWDGNVGVCGHNRGARYTIGGIKDLKIGDTITYTTVYGTRTYAVSFVGTIDNTDWSYLQATTDNRITLTTCLANHPESRVCVQATEIK